MNLPSKYPTTPPVAEHSAEPVDIVSVPKMHRLLAQAAHLAASAGLAPDAFAGVAWHAYLRTVPGAAEQVADAQLVTAIEQLRNSGRLAKA